MRDAVLSLAEFLNEQPDLPDRQIWRLYEWDSFEKPSMIDDRITMRKLLDEQGVTERSLSIEDGAELLEDLCSQYGASPCACVLDDREMRWEMDDSRVEAKYDPHEPAVVFKKLPVMEGVLLHEFTHHWIGEAVYLYNEKLCARPASETNPYKRFYMPLIEPHGPIFCEAFVHLLSSHWDLDPVALRRSAVQGFGVVIADCNVERLRRKLLRADTMLDSSSIRDLMLKPAKIEEDTYEGAGWVNAPEVD